MKLKYYINKAQTPHIKLHMLLRGAVIHAYTEGRRERLNNIRALTHHFITLGYISDILDHNKSQRFKRNTFTFFLNVTLVMTYLQTHHVQRQEDVRRINQ